MAAHPLLKEVFNPATHTEKPKHINDLNFVGRNENGTANWWNVTPPKTNYWHVHEMLGRAYAFELLDLIQSDSKKTGLSSHAFSFIASAIVRQRHTMSDGLYIGFFDAISEYLITGEVDR